MVVPETPPGRPRALTIDGLRLNVLEHGGDDRHGARRPLLLLHGGMAHARWWDLVAPALAAHCRPFALDRRGHGDSDWTAPERYGWERDLLDVEQAMRALSPDPWTVLGHSQGGLLAVHLATRGNVALERVVLLDVPLDPTSPRLVRAGRALNRIPQIRYETLEHAVRRFQPYPAPHRVPDDVRLYLARHSFKPTPDGGWTSKFHWKMYRRERRGPSPLTDFGERLRRVPVPTLSVRGEHSSILSRDEHAEMVARLERGVGVEIAGATHSLHAEQPDAVARSIAQFLAHDGR
ncbi:MAG: alpha/beta hydrolase [Thermodesulfobacteriota bacterium]